MKWTLQKCSKHKFMPAGFSATPKYHKMTAFTSVRAASWTVTTSFNGSYWPCFGSVTVHLSSEESSWGSPLFQLHLSFQTGRWPPGGRALGGRAAPIPSRPMVEVGKADEQQREGRTDCEQKQPGFRVPFHTQKALCFLVFPLLQPCLNPG